MSKLASKDRYRAGKKDEKLRERRETGTETNRQTYIQIDKHTNICFIPDKETNRQTYSQIDKHTNICFIPDRETNRQTYS